MKDLKTCREEIDAIDKEIIALFEKRMHVSKDVITYKLAHDMQIFQKDREKEVIQKNVDRLEDKSLESYAKTFVQDTMNLSKSYQSTFIPLKKYEATELKENFKVGYQGVPGSFSNQALNCWFGDIEGINYPHFEDVYQALEKGEIDYGVLPLENSSTGAINDNYDLLTQYGFYIVGEQSITIDQNLLGIKGATLEDIKDVYSHVQGLKQTSEFLNAHHIEGHDYLNTAWLPSISVKHRINISVPLPLVKQLNSIILILLPRQYKMIKAIIHALSLSQDNMKSDHLLIVSAWSSQSIMKSVLFMKS